MRERHGATGTRLYDLWRAMRRRCSAPVTAKTARPYADRGITVCAEWHRSFTAFRDWAWVNGYTDALSLDRVDNYAGYSPSNCRWVTRQEQNGNRRPGAEWALPQRKIPAEQYVEIQSARQTGRTLASIAADYQVSEATIHRIVHLETVKEN